MSGVPRGDDKVTKARNLKLANYRRPFEAKKLADADKKQLAKVLKAEGTTLKEARDGDEPLTMEIVDVVDGNNAAYQLWLWSFGSGVLFKAGTTTVVGTVAQHSFECDDADLAKSLKAAWKSGAKKLKVEETIDSFDVPENIVSAKAEGSIVEQLKTFAATKAKLNLGQRDDIANALYDLKAKLFPSKKRQVYPRRRPATLTAEQRALIETSHTLGGDLYDLDLQGMPQSTELMMRMIGKAPQGPSDVEVTVGKETLPLWIAVADVASGHMNHKAVVDAFKKLPSAKALAAWNEIANDKAYDVLNPRDITPKEYDRDDTPAKMEYRARVYSWLADASVALGDAGKKAAHQLLAVKLDWDWGQRWLIGMLALTRHGGLDAKYDDRIIPIRDNGNVVCSRTSFAQATIDEIIKSLPTDRRNALPPAPKR